MSRSLSSRWPSARVILTIQARVVAGARGAGWLVLVSSPFSLGVVTAAGALRRMSLRSSTALGLLREVASWRAQDWWPSFRVAPQNSQTPEAPPPSGAPQVGQCAEEMALSVSLFALGLRAKTMRRWETEDCSWRWIFPVGSAVKRVPD